MKFYNDQPPYYVFTVKCRSIYDYEQEIAVAAESAEIACKMFKKMHPHKDFISCTQGPKLLIESKIFEA